MIKSKLLFLGGEGADSMQPVGYLGGLMRCRTRNDAGTL